MGIFTGVVSGARFRPFSYQEMLAPLAAYTQEYNNIQEGLSTLSQTANSFDEYLKGTKAGEIVKAYNDNLQNIAGTMSTEGLGLVNRNTLYKMKRDYMTDILPINKAAQNLDAMTKVIQQGRIKDPSFMVAHMPTVDDLLQDPSATPLTASGDAMYTHAAKSSQAASARKYLNSTEVGKGIMRYYIDNVVKQGYSPEALAKFKKMADSIPEFRDAMQNIRDMYRINEFGSTDQARADAYIMKGIMDGAAYQEQHKYMQNPEAAAELDWKYYQKKAALQNYYDMQKMKAAAEAKQKEALDAIGITSESMLDASGDLAKYKQLIAGLAGKDGKGLNADYIGKDGLNTNLIAIYEKYSRLKANDDAANAGHTNSAGVYVDNGRKPQHTADDYLKSIGVKKVISKDQYELMKNELKYSNTGKLSYYKSGSGFIWDMNKRLDSLGKERAVYNINGDDATKHIAETIKGNVMYAYNNDALKGRIERLDIHGKGTGKSEDIDDFKKDDSKILSIGVSPQNDKLIVKTENHIYAINPQLVNTETARALKNREVYQKQLEQAYKQMYHQEPKGQALEIIQKEANEQALREIHQINNVNVSQVKPQSNSHLE